MQYIGIKDVNGKELREDDIMKYEWDEGTLIDFAIEYSDLGMFMQFPLNKSSNIWPVIILSQETNNVEIISNIYENSVLLDEN
jgi:hypothetical protein